MSHDLSNAEIGLIRITVVDEFSSDKLRQFSRLRLEISSLHILLEWLTIAGLITLAKLVNHPVVNVVAVILIGVRQHALAILMHEGTHYRLANNRVLNDRIAEIFLAWPIFISLPTYRESHFAHHRYVNTTRDPDWQRKQNPDWDFPKTSWQMTVLFLKDLLLFRIIPQVADTIALLDFPRFLNRNDCHREMLRFAFYLVAITLITWLGGWQDFLIFWILPFYLVFMIIAHLRSISEHFGLNLNEMDPLTQTRTTQAGLLEGFLICPKNVNYHLDHHLFPSVPFYNLPDLHRELANSQAYLNHASITQGYFGVLMECMTPQKESIN